MLRTIDPTTGEERARFDVMTDVELERALAVAAEAQSAWAGGTDFVARAETLIAVAHALRQRVGELAEGMAHEMGKPLAQGRAEVEKCAWVCEHYASHAAGYLADEHVETGRAASYVAYRPLGVILAVMPWNFPLWQVLRCAAPGLMAGNGVVLKHAANVTGTALAIETLFAEAGAPPGLFTTLRVTHAQVERVLDHPRIRAVTLTGSTEAGRTVAALAGARLKRAILELGGSDPYLILEDADLEAAADVCAKSRLINSGQSCIAAKRFVVVRSVHDAFVDRLVAQMAAAKMGSPLEEGVDVGPQARHDLRDALHRQVVESCEAGAVCVLGGEVPAGKGAFYPPTVLTRVSEASPAYRDELFGPVASVIAVDDEASAIQVANDSPFGLGAAVFSRDTARAEVLAREALDAGCCSVNAAVASDPRLPFGGVKASGFGRELGVLGIRELTNPKTVVVR